VKGGQSILHTVQDGRPIGAGFVNPTVNTDPRALVCERVYDACKINPKGGPEWGRTLARDADDF